MSSMKISKATDSEFSNYVINHPHVRADVADAKAGVMDLTPLITSSNHIVLQGEHGIFVGAQIIEGCVEGHPAIMPEGRGKWAIEFGLEAQCWMFCRTPTVEILTRIPTIHKAAEALAVRCGFRPRWSRPDCVWRGKHGPYRVWSRTLQEWLTGFEIDDVVAEMWAAGLERKAAAWYNRWAALSREPLWQGGLN